MRQGCTSRRGPKDVMLCSHRLLLSCSLNALQTEGAFWTPHSALDCCDLHLRALEPDPRE